MAILCEGRFELAIILLLIHHPKFFQTTGHKLKYLQSKWENKYTKAKHERMNQAGCEIVAHAGTCWPNGESTMLGL